MNTLCCVVCSLCVILGILSSWDCAFHSFIVQLCFGLFPISGFSDICRQYGHQKILCERMLMINSRVHHKVWKPCSHALSANLLMISYSTHLRRRRTEQQTLGFASSGLQLRSPADSGESSSVFINIDIFYNICGTIKVYVNIHSTRESQVSFWCSYSLAHSCPDYVRDRKQNSIHSYRMHVAGLCYIIIILYGRVLIGLHYRLYKINGKLPYNRDLIALASDG